MRLWRIAGENRDYKASDLSGGGAAASPGRWNASGEFVVYCAPTLPMAALETAAHINPLGLPLNKFVVEIEVPDDIWSSREQVEVANLDPAWCAIPAGKASVDIGSAWYRKGATLFLLVPSSIVPEDSNVLINATHPLAAKLKARTVRPFVYHTIFRPT